MEKTDPEKIIAELAVLHEISTFEFLDSEESVARNVVERASRLFGVRYLALLRGAEGGRKLIASWGFRNPADIDVKIREGAPNQYSFSFSEPGMLFMEQSHPLSERERRLYNIFAREVEKALKYAENIIERRKAEEDIRRLNAELEQKVEERTRQLIAAQDELVRKEKLAILGQLSGSVGHELRNPLGVMSNAVYFLKAVQGDGDETVKEYLGIIEKEIANSQRIIADLLDFARTKPPSRQAVTPDELVRQSLERCAIPENVTLTVDAPMDLPRLNIDPLQMGQVLTNFITNGVQAMGNGGALHVAARRVSSYEFQVSSSNLQPETLNLKLETDYVEISVTDTGEGITPENMKKLFQPLFTTKPKGIGLGLVVCKNLVGANGGRIEVESEVGKGTRFSVVLPMEEG